MKIVRFILKFFLFIAIFFVIQFGIGQILKGDSDSLARKTLHDLHEEPQIDMLFLGGSHVYRGLNAPYVEKQLNCNVFSASTSSQSIDGSLAILKEIYKFHPELKTVYMDMDYDFSLKCDFNKRTTFKEIYAVSDCLVDPKIKFEYLTKATSPDYYLSSFLSIGIDRYTLNPKKIIPTIKSRLNGQYKTFSAPSLKTSSYDGKGYIPMNKKHAGLIYGREVENTIFDISKVSKDWENTVLEIIDFCKENSLNLVFFSIPEPDYFILSIVNYDDYISYVNTLIESSGFKYFDYNLCRNEVLDLTGEDYYDENHLNKNGAEKFTTVLVKTILDNAAPEDKRYFYPSIKEKSADTQELVAGFHIRDSNDGKTMNLETAAKKRDSSEIFYDYIFIDSNKNECVLAEKTKDPFIAYPEKTSGQIKIKCYLNETYVGEATKNFNTKWIK